MNLIFFDTLPLHHALKPFTLTRPLAGIRVGICTIAEKWQRSFYANLGKECKVSYLSQAYLQEKYPYQISGENIFINGALCPDAQLLAAIEKLQVGEALLHDDGLLAFCLEKEHAQKLDVSVAWLSEKDFWKEIHQDKANFNAFPLQRTIFHEAPVTLMQHTWDIFTKNPQQIEQDFALLTRGRSSQAVADPHTIVYGAKNVFIEEGVHIRAAIINAEGGPVYIGKNATIYESAVVKGPFALCENATVNMGAKIREGTTIGPHSKVGGEVKNTVFFGNSNKGHEGFVGNSVIGEWCNFGADTNTSNLKNNYGNVRLWSYLTKNYEDTGTSFCGLMMGDHSKCGINTMFNTGTVVGVNANIFGSGYPPKYIPSFTWGGIKGQEPYEIAKALEVAHRMINRRNLQLETPEENILRFLHKNRKNEL